MADIRSWRLHAQVLVDRMAQTIKKAYGKPSTHVIITSRLSICDLAGKIDATQPHGRWRNPCLRPLGW